MRMFKFFKRLKTVVSSELHSMIDKAEDPEKMLDQFLRDMEADIQDVEKATAKVMAEQKLLKKKCDDAQELGLKREEQAVKALEANNEELARKALEDKNRVVKELQQLNTLYLDTSNHVEELKAKLKEMKAEYRELEQKKEALKTRASTAKARTKMNRTMSSMDSDSSRKGFERMEKKILAYEAEAETSEDLRLTNRSLDDELKQLEQESSVDEELAKLKERVQNNS